ncbi:NUDIX hydrolase [Allostreptomyces psammosilenae]|uniref:8-oxo-dGTP pyrophosphatase MutT (NUDIX family) n=1 Tax=Allostreptomyces psammosilenae TaxID=1892865 RepID=A0A852ZT61_9ACTN|nr:CoA pyrophosphatase [Allostreptomyces psammosilenae]NYI05606.1 8-oxo-dGTP pyrophosphatase MutT (NUDIX family) [Allostreptomyces psammosilenae]
MSDAALLPPASGWDGTRSLLLDHQGLPGWLSPVAEALPRVRAEQLSHFLPPRRGGRRSAVLILFGEGSRGPDVLLIQRADGLRKHAGQPGFPGGGVDAADGDPADPGTAVRAALREAWEETGLEPSGVQVFGMLPSLYLPVSDFVVAPVLGWWREPTAVAPVDLGEVAEVFRVPVADLVEPVNRVRVRHPSGYVGPGFRVADRVVWGFTGGLIAGVLRFAGWERPWDETAEVMLRD